MAAADNSGGTTAPASRAFNIAPGDGSDMAFETRAIWVGGAGTMKVATRAGDIVTLQGITAGSLIPLRVVRVYSTDTTATLLVGLY
jgi:hypothetical protein